MNRTGQSPLFTWLGVLSVVYIVGMTSWGYRSLAPVFIVLLTGVVTVVLGYGTRRAPRREEP